MFLEEKEPAAWLCSACGCRFVPMDSRLIQEVQRLKDDALRYRYLRDNLLHGVAHPMGDAIGMSEVIFGDDPDAAIDAKMRAREGDTYDYEADDQAFDAAREDRVFGRGAR